MINLLIMINVLFQVHSALYSGITDEPELSFVALSSTMSTPQRQPKFTSSPADAGQRRMGSPHYTPDALRSTIRDANLQNISSSSKGHSLASFEEHEKSIICSADDNSSAENKIEAQTSVKTDKPSNCLLF